MKHAFCTLFDQNYLNRGLALYESLRKHCASFALYIFCFDDKTYQILTQLDLANVELIPLSQFEDEALLQVKPTRTMGEYCWTCTPSIIRYVLLHTTHSACTYLDADLYFFHDPSVLIEEMGRAQILLTDHHYSPQYDNANLSGRFCVQFMTFKREAQALEALNWWRDACLQWCYNRVEEGKFGDQKYLDDWPTRYHSTHILNHMGAGIAPWNVQQYRFTRLEDQLICHVGHQSNLPVVFFHFHGLGLYKTNKADLGQYKLSQNAKEHIYQPYLKHLYNINHKLKNKLETPFIDSFAKSPNLLDRTKRLLRGNLNIAAIEP